VRVLIVDDEAPVRESLTRALRLDGYDVQSAQSGAKALATLGQDAVDVVVLDVLMPEPDGLETCREMRRRGYDVPVLMLTARSAVRDRVEGLEAGADDYLVKPFALDELRARLRALVRRASTMTAGETLVVGNLELHTATREVRRGQRVLDPLTRTEFALLELFMRNPRVVLERRVIFDRVWGYDFGSNSNSLEVYVGYLRRKTEAEGEPRLIHTVRGVGYVLREPT
jgi:two-component system, OmpR family, response regulator MprA